MIDSKVWGKIFTSGYVMLRRVKQKLNGTDDRLQLQWPRARFPLLTIRIGGKLIISNKEIMFSGVFVCLLLKRL